MLMNQLHIKYIFILGLFFTTAIYWAGLYGPFMLDDLQTIDIAKVSTLSFDEIIPVMFANEAGPLNRPISILSFILSHWFLGDSPFAYKIFNLCLHLGCAILCFVVMRRLFTIFVEDDDKKAHVFALIVSLAWALHPLMVSTTLYAVQRMAMLSTFFMMLSMFFYLKLRFDSLETPPKIGYGFLILLTWTLAIFSKENGVLLPFFILSIEIVALTRERKSLKWLMNAIVFSALIILGGFFYYIAHWQSFEASFAAKGFTLSEYLYVQLKALVFYLKLIVLPNINAMGLYHDDFNFTFSSPLWLNASILLGLLIIAFRSLKSFPLVALGIFWFFAGHALESSILPLEPVFEHRNYLASIGILFAIGSFIMALKESEHFQRLGVVLPCVWVIILSTFTFIRVEGWSSTEQFLAISNQNHPKSARAQIETANFLFNIQEYKLALQVLDKADALSPHNSGPKLHQVLAYCFSDSMPKQLFDEANNSLQTKTITPYTILVFDALVKNHFNQTCSGVTLEQSQHLINTALTNTFVQAKPRYLAVLFHLQAGLFVKAQQMEKAIAALDKSYNLNHARIEPLFEKTQLLIIQNKVDLAKEHLTFIQAHPKVKLKTNKNKLQQLQSQIE